LDDNAENCLLLPPRFEVDGKAWRTEVEARALNRFDVSPSGSAEGGFLSLLTPSERVVTIDVARGFPTEDIASRHCLSPLTVKRHLVNVYRKARIGGQNARTALVARVWRAADGDSALAAELRSDLFDNGGCEFPSC
jgi:DNA-binding NarL/FixJ family response regulator